MPDRTPVPNPEGPVILSSSAVPKHVSDYAPSYGQNAANVIAPSKKATTAPMSPVKLAKVNALLSKGKFKAAIKAITALRRSEPKVAKWPYLLGICHQKLGSLDLALIEFNAAIAIEGETAELLFARGNLSNAKGDHANALSDLSKVIELQPENAEALNNCGNVLTKLDKLDLAKKIFVRALAIQPDNHVFMNNFGNALRASGKFDAALQAFDATLKLAPDYAAAYQNMGVTLKDMELYDDALICCDKSIALAPEVADFVYNRGNLLWKMRRIDEAWASFEKAISLSPTHIKTLSNQAIVMAESHRFEESMALLEEAIKLSPNNALAQWNMALTHLRLGDYIKGFEAYRWRFKNLDLRNLMPIMDVPEWNGDFSIEGKTLLIHWEQGLGDSIQFVRFIDELMEYGANIVLEVQKPLVELFNTLPQMKSGRVTIIGAGDERPDIDCYCMLMNLPFVLGTKLGSLRREKSYLSVDKDRAALWQGRLQEALSNRVNPKDKAPVIGLVWSGSVTHKGDAQRSMPLGDLLAGLPEGPTYVSLQKELRDDDRVVLHKAGNVLHFGDEIEDFADTAALTAQMDLVISVDTSVAHLAGALGVPLWVMLSYLPDWRWLMDRSDSPWYPSAKLFRQSSYGDWDSVLSQIADELDN